MRIGITGHQNLSFSIIDWIKQELLIELNQLNIDEAYSCLAIGADQIFAEIILENKIPLITIIPCVNYKTTFDNKGLISYNHLLKQSTSIIQLDFQKPSEEAFFEAGKTVILNSDILFAIWNNLPAKGLGGTADIVSIATSLNKKIIHFNPITKTKKLINYG
jgi:hypothetical protein